MTNWNRKQINSLSDLNKNRQINKNRRDGVIEEVKEDLLSKSDLLDDFYNVDGCGLISEEVFEDLFSSSRILSNVVYKGFKTGEIVRFNFNNYCSYIGSNSSAYSYITLYNAVLRQGISERAILKLKGDK